MKKLLITIILFAMCGSVLAQVQIGKNATVAEKIQAKPVYRTKTIDITKDSIIPKDTVKALVVKVVEKDSVIREQIDTIRAKNNEIIKFKDYFKNELWASQNPFVFYMAFIFGFIGLFFMWLCRTYFGASTDEYKWKRAFGSKNIVRGVIGFILASLTIYLTLYLFPIVGQVGVVTNTYALIIGAGWQVFAKKLMKFFETKAVKPEPVIEEIKPEIKPEQ